MNLGQLFSWKSRLSKQIVIILSHNPIHKAVSVQSDHGSVLECWSHLGNVKIGNVLSPTSPKSTCSSKCWNTVSSAHSSTNVKDDKLLLAFHTKDPFAKIATFSSSSFLEHTISGSSGS